MAFLGTDRECAALKAAILDYGQVAGHDVNLGTVEDDLCSAEGGQTGAQNILAQLAPIAGSDNGWTGPVGVIGTTCSGAARAALPLISEAGSILISGSNTSPSLTSDLFGTAGETMPPGTTGPRTTTCSRAVRWPDSPTTFSVFVRLPPFMTAIRTPIT